MRVQMPASRTMTFIAWLLAASVLVMLHGALAAEPVPNEVCLSCHSAPGLEKEREGKKVSLSVDAQRFARSVHGSLPCTACHSDITQVPHASELKPVQCGQCHPKVGEIYRESVHGRANMNGDGDAARCSSCHGKHDIFPVTNPESKVYPLQLPYTCGACHGNPELAKKHNIPVANAYQLYMDSIHGQALEKSGLLVAANCSSCHGSHDIRPKQDPKSKVNRVNVPSTCGTCHVGILNNYFEGVHGRAVKQGNLAAPVCSDCHTAHEIRRVETAGWKLDIVKECGTCHQESLRTYRDTFHGQVTSLGFIRVARCSDCHGSHKILGRSDPRSSIAPAHLVATCQKCHPRANATFAQFSPHADYADKQRNPGLYYAAIFMKTLLTGVFVFFGLHTCLWLFRSIIDVWGRKRSD
ncbi:MAG: hypothetical protein ACM3TN_12755 [Alphaproteobacteria bacterium]